MAEVVVRALESDDWAVLRELRLAALAESSDSFVSTFDQERNDSEGLWRRRAERRAIAMVADEAVGLIGWSPHADFLELIGLWVDPARRGEGVSDALVGFVRHRVAATTGLELRLAVAAGNLHALRCYQRTGFQVTGAQDHPTAGPLLWMSDNPL
ncbi:MAG TPA: GNAT family N-acetyltransferase [Acidimicrobiales bacterium]|nr:GNAT family N-acetyltransferase [Acidimicrobiales bacterium]